MLTWGDFKKSAGLNTSISPCFREKNGKKVIFWFKNGNGDVADLVTKLREKLPNAEIVWDEKEGLTGVKIDLNYINKLP